MNKPVNIYNRFLKELAHVIIFAGLSLTFGMLSEIEGGISNFREVPLLVYVFYLKTPWLILLTALISSIPTSPNSIFIDNFLIHFPGLLAALGFYFVLGKHNISAIAKGSTWTIFTCLYYALFLIPTWAYLSQNNFDNSYFTTYIAGLKSVRFEMIATAFITGLYLMQKEVRNNLVQHKKNLEKIVEERTEELEAANSNLLSMNEKLFSSSEEVRMINKNLDELVKQRSKKIEEQLQVLNKYADMNSHEVRAPLARMLGLILLINLEQDENEKNELYHKLMICATELDSIIKKMNRLLEKEIIPKSISGKN